VVSLGIFSAVPPTEPCALRSTQPLRVSTRDFSWGKGGRCVWLTTYHPCSAETSRKSGSLNYPAPLGPPRPVAADLYFYVTVYIFIWRLSAVWYSLSYSVIPSACTVVRLSNSCYILIFRVCLHSLPTAAVQDTTVFHMTYSHCFLPAL